MHYSLFCGWNHHLNFFGLVGAVKPVEKEGDLIKGDVGNTILDTKGKIDLALFSVCNKQLGVNCLL